MSGVVQASAGDIGGWIIEPEAIYNRELIGASDKYIGLVLASTASSDVGSESAFFAGADDEYGANAQISFAGDGKILGTGIYVRNSKEFLIGAETIFGDGRDGDLRFSGSTGTPVVAWVNSPSFNGNYNFG